MISIQDKSLRVVLGLDYRHWWPYHSPIALDPMACDILTGLGIGAELDLGLNVDRVLEQAFEAFLASLEARQL